MFMGKFMMIKIENEEESGTYIPKTNEISTQCKMIKSSSKKLYDGLILLAMVIKND